MNKKWDGLRILLMIAGTLAILTAIFEQSWEDRRRRKEAIRTNYITDLEIWPGKNIRPMTTNWTNLDSGMPMTNIAGGIDSNGVPFGKLPLKNAERKP